MNIHIEPLRAICTKLATAAVTTALFSASNVACAYMDINRADDFGQPPAAIIVPAIIFGIGFLFNWLVSKAFFLLTGKELPSFISTGIGCFFGILAFTAFFFYLGFAIFSIDSTEGARWVLGISVALSISLLVSSLRDERKNTELRKHNSQTTTRGSLS